MSQKFMQCWFYIIVESITVKQYIVFVVWIQNKGPRRQHKVWGEKLQIMLFSDFYESVLFHISLIFFAEYLYMFLKSPWDGCYKCYGCILVVEYLLCEICSVFMEQIGVAGQNFGKDRRWFWKWWASGILSEDERWLLPLLGWSWYRHFKRR